MKEVMQAIKDLWKWFNGKKRQFALAYWTIVIPSLSVLYPDGTPTDVYKWVTIAGIVLSATGYGHAAFKGIKK